MTGHTGTMNTINAKFRIKLNLESFSWTDKENS